MLDNLEEYEDSSLYESEYGLYQGDFDLFLNLIQAGSVLDLACGTGRLTIPLAQKGLDVVGFDASDTMLSIARKKSQNLPIEWIQGDMKDFHLNQAFDLIVIAGNAFQALLSEADQIQMLDCVKKHLKLTGLFVFNTRNPHPNSLTTTHKFEYWHTFQDQHGEDVQVYGKQDCDKSKQIITYTTKRVWKDKETVTKIQLRFTSYNQLMKLLNQRGFEVCSVYGDDQRISFDKKSPAIIPVCRPTPLSSLKQRKEF